MPGRLRGVSARGCRGPHCGSSGAGARPCRSGCCSKARNSWAATRVESSRLRRGGSGIVPVPRPEAASRSVSAACCLSVIGAWVSWYRKISRLAYVGSENFTNASLNRNRELGVITSNSAIVSTIKSVLTVDAERAAIWTP